MALLQEQDQCFVHAVEIVLVVLRGRICSICLFRGSVQQIRFQNE